MNYNRRRSRRVRRSIIPSARAFRLYRIRQCNAARAKLTAAEWRAWCDTYTVRRDRGLLALIDIEERATRALYNLPAPNPADFAHYFEEEPHAL